MCEKKFRNGEFRLSGIHEFQLKDAFAVRLCELRTRFRLERSNVYTHFSLEEIEERNLKVVKETFTSLFPSYALKNKREFQRLFTDFCKWVAHEEPLIIHETARFFVHRKNSKRVIGIAFSVWAPDISDKRTTEAWALRSLLQCNNYLLSITRLKKSFLLTPFEKITQEKVEYAEGLEYWESVYERVVKMIDAMGKVANFADACSSS